MDVFQYKAPTKARIWQQITKFWNLASLLLNVYQVYFNLVLSNYMQHVIVINNTSNVRHISGAFHTILKFNKLNSLQIWYMVYTNETLV